MRKRFLLLLLIGLSGLPAKADFGDADFPVGLFNDGSKSYHDARCRKIKNKCRIRFQGPGMWVEGQGGIQRDQFISYRSDEDGEVSAWSNNMEYYNYIKYRSKNGQIKEALFLFANYKAHINFIRAFAQWKRQEPKPIPNYRMPNSQGPQDTQGRDKGLNPYDNPPITDWSEQTTKEQNEKCKSRIYKTSPECR